MFPECCPYSKILSTFVSVEQSTDIMKVFSHCPFKKMWKFSMSEGQRTALIHSFRHMLQGDTLSFLTHIYPSVEHWVRLFLA